MILVQEIQFDSCDDHWVDNPGHLCPPGGDQIGF